MTDKDKIIKAEFQEAAAVAWLKLKQECPELLANSCERCLQRTAMLAFHAGIIWHIERELALRGKAG